MQELDRLITSLKRETRDNMIHHFVDSLLALETLTKESIANLVNRMSLENLYNAPDYILGAYIYYFLETLKGRHVLIRDELIMELERLIRIRDHDLGHDGVSFVPDLGE
jgi:hypothetical protein